MSILIANFGIFGLLGFRRKKLNRWFFTEEYSPIKTSSVELLMKEIKPVFTEEYEFEYGDL